MASPRLWVEKITFSDDSQVCFNKNDVIVIVGPNNSGKSATLRAIRDKIYSDNNSPVIKELNTCKEGLDSDVSEWLDSFTRKNDPSSQDPVYQALNASVHKSQISSWWNNKGKLQNLARFFCHLLTADERLSAANPPQNIAIVREPPTHPIHYMLRDDRIEENLSSQFQKAFGQDLIVNRNAGNQVPLHVGKKPTIKPNQDRLSYEYIEELEKLPFLHTQGDGMRSFTGVLLYTSVGRESILLIDEPEAFLHPPQARLLGRMLIADKPDSRQLFISTHSGDILRGI